MASKNRKWLAFYAQYLSDVEATDFVATCEADGAPKAALYMMHQTQPLVTLADDVRQLRPGRDPLAILFLGRLRPEAALFDDPLRLLAN
jgi:hypothetical protein